MILRHGTELDVTEQPTDKPGHWVTNKEEYNREKDWIESRAKVSFKIRDRKDVEMGVSDMNKAVSGLKSHKNQRETKKSIEKMETDPDESESTYETKERKSISGVNKATQCEKDSVKQNEDIRYSERSSYRVVIAVKKAASLLNSANDLLNEDNLKKARLFILEFGRTLESQQAKNTFTKAIQGTLKDLANTHV